jgi:two-component system nitrogen regulation response regulator GlnG
MPRVLVVDDDRTVLRFVEKAFEGRGLEILGANNARDGMAMLKKELPDVLLLDVMLPESTGIELVSEIRRIDVRLPVIFITALNDSDMAIEAMKLGAYDYLLKPLDQQLLRELIERALETRRLMQAPVHLPTDDPPPPGDALVGRSPTMIEVYKQIGRVAAQNVTVLIRGESGTGKELIARAIYQHSHRTGECFLAVNCAALSDTLLESELFGHEKGSFTGADRRRIGKFEQCNGGTIFLDEIGDMSPLTQSKVLRLLQEQKFERVGGQETIEVDVRLISATNRPLEQMVEEGKFRLDLLHRLNAFEIHLPPLRERGSDIDILIHHFLAIFNTQLDKQVTGLSSEAMAMLQQYSWPGNVRELQSVLRKAMLMASGPVIVPEFLPKEIFEERPGVAGGDSGKRTTEAPLDLESFINDRIAGGSKNLYAETLEAMERHLLARVLRETGGNQSKAAEQLGITRGSLRNKIRTLGIWIGQVVGTQEEAEPDTAVPAS